MRLKPEQRILALTIVKVRGKHRFLLGVVYRGSRWLDGVIFEPLGRKRSTGISKLIQDSRYFKELRYILLQAPTLMDGKRLYDDLELPVVEFRPARRGKRVVNAWGLEHESADAFLKAFTMETGELEAAFTANLLRTALERLR